MSYTENSYESYKRTVDRKKAAFRKYPFLSLSPVKAYADYLVFKGDKGASPNYKSGEELDLKYIDSQMINITFDLNKRAEELEVFLESFETDPRSIGKLSRMMSSWKKNVIVGAPSEVFRLFHIEDDIRYNEREFFEKHFFDKFGHAWEKYAFETLKGHGLPSGKKYIEDCNQLFEDVLIEVKKDYETYFCEEKDIGEKYKAYINDNGMIVKEKVINRFYFDFYHTLFKHKREIGSVSKEIAKNFVFYGLFLLRINLLECEDLPGKNQKLRRKAVDAINVKELIRKCFDVYDINEASTLKAVSEYIADIKVNFEEAVSEDKCYEILPSIIIVFDILLREVLLKALKQVKNREEYCAKIEEHIIASELSQNENSIAALKLNSLANALLYFEQYCYYYANIELNRILQTYEQELILKKAKGDFVLPGVMIEDNLVQAANNSSPRTFNEFIESIKPSLRMSTHSLVESKIGESAGFTNDSDIDFIAAYNFLIGSDSFKFERRTKDRNNHSKGSTRYKLQSFVKDYLANCDHDGEVSLTIEYQKRWESFEALALGSFEGGAFNAAETSVAFSVLNMYRKRIEFLYGLNNDEERDACVDALMAKATSVLSSYILTYDMSDIINRSAKLVEECVALAYEIG